MKYTFKLSSLILLFSIFFLFNTKHALVNAQNRQKITGVVVDESSVPIIGANVVVKEISAGTITDVNGNFSLSVPIGSRLQVSFLGYESVNLKITEKRNYRIVMKESTTDLDEVVVVGYGSVRRGDLTGAVSSINMDDLNKVHAPSFDVALGGRISGVQVTTNDGQPGSGANIVIRGANSLTQNVSPIYVIDGFVFEDFDPRSIAPQDIESMTVLKDASSTAIYGAKGANGVIVITTKTAKVGKPIINYSGSVGLNKSTKRMELMDGYEFMKFTIERFPDAAYSVYYPEVTKGEFMDPEKYRNAPTIDWQDMILRTGFTQTHSLSINGGVSGTKYMASLSYFDQNGTVINTRYKKITGRVVLDQAINKRLDMKLNAFYTRDRTSGIVATDASVNNQASSSLFFSAYGFRPVVSLDNSATEDFMNSLVDDDVSGASDYRLNPKIMAENEEKNTINSIFIPGITLNYKFNKYWSLMVRAGLDHRVRENNYFYNSKTRLGMSRPGMVNAGVQGGVNIYQYDLITNEDVLSFKKTFAKIHVLDAQLGTSYQWINTSSHGVKYQNIPYEQLGLSGIDNGIPVPQTSRLEDSRAVSFFGRVNYNLLSKYLFTVTMRADGSSKFSAQNRWGYFPSAAFAWRMSSEPIIRNITVINDAKLRVSYGLSGNNRVGNYDYYAKLDTPYGMYYSFGNETPQIGAYRSNLANPDLKWETTAQLNIGYDLSLWKNRVNLVFDWYHKKTTDLLLLAKLPATTGLPQAYKNIGSIENRGFEITLSTVNVHNKDFSWTTNFNISFNKNKILSLNRSQDYMESDVKWDAQYTAPLYRAIVGKPVAQFWGYKWDGIYQYNDFDEIKGAGGAITYVLKNDVTANGNLREKIKPGDIKYKDQDGDLQITSKDRTVIGNPMPKHIGGFGNDFRYKNFSLNIFFQWSYGGDVFNANRIYFEGGYNVRPLQNQFKSFENRWTPENQTNKMFRCGVGGSESGAGPNGYYSDYTMEDGSFLRLKNVSLDYQLPQKLIKNIGVRNISVGVAAQNLWTWTAYSGLDPEVSTRHSILTPAFDYSAYPRAMSFLFNLKFTL